MLQMKNDFWKWVEEEKKLSFSHHLLDKRKMTVIQTPEMMVCHYLDFLLFKEGKLVSIACGAGVYSVSVDGSEPIKGKSLPVILESIVEGEKKNYGI